jgi:ABC-type nitrate/sulfonate/bicarbonate transport system permease component
LFFLIFSRVTHITTASLFGDISVSVLRIATAYVLAAVLAWVLAVLFYRGARAVIALPLFDVLQSFPTFAILPVATSVWGASNTTVVVFLVITIIWPILFSIVSSLKFIEHDWHDAVVISRVSGFAYLRYFLWPASVPGLITGSVIGLGEAWEAVVATEIIVHAPQGLGSFFNLHSDSSGTTMFGILGLLLLIFTVNKFLWFPLLEKSHHMMEE